MFLSLVSLCAFHLARTKCCVLCNAELLIPFPMCNANDDDMRSPVRCSPSGRRKREKCSKCHVIKKRKHFQREDGCSRLYRTCVWAKWAATAVTVPRISLLAENACSKFARPAARASSGHPYSVEPSSCPENSRPAKQNEAGPIALHAFSREMQLQ